MRVGPCSARGVPRATSPAVTQVVLAICLLAGVAAAEPARDARVAHLAQALAELQADPRALERVLYDAGRARCGTTPTTACLIAVAREVAPARLAAADVIVTNLHAEHDLLDQATRVRLVRTSSDYHTGVLAELRAKYAILAAELVLAEPDDNLAARIDRFCALRDQTARRCAPGAPACLGSIAYQRCAAGLVWFASTEEAR